MTKNTTYLTNRSLVFGIMLLSCLLTISSLAVERYVPSNYPTLQSLTEKSNSMTEQLRIDRWELTLQPGTPANGKMKLSGEFNAAPGVLNLVNDGVSYDFIATGDTVTEELAPGATNWHSSRGSKWIYKDARISGTFLLNIGGSSRSKFAVSTKKGLYDVLEGETEVKISMQSGGFDDCVIINPVLKRNPATGSMFDIGRHTYKSEEFFIDALIIRNTNPVDKDTVRMAARIPGSPLFNPNTDNFLLEIGVILIEVPAGQWSVDRSGTRLTYKCDGLVGSKSKLTLKMDTARRTLSLQITDANLSGITDVLRVNIEYGSFAQENVLLLQHKVTGCCELFTY